PASRWCASPRSTWCGTAWCRRSCAPMTSATARRASWTIRRGDESEASNSERSYRRHRRSIERGRVETGGAEARGAGPPCGAGCPGNRKAETRPRPHDGAAVGRSRRAPPQPRFPRQGQADQRVVLPVRRQRWPPRGAAAAGRHRDRLRDGRARGRGAGQDHSRPSAAPGRARRAASARPRSPALRGSGADGEHRDRAAGGARYRRPLCAGAETRMNDSDETPESKGLLSRLRDRLRSRDAEALLRDTIEEIIEERDVPLAPIGAQERTLIANVFKLRELTAYDVMVPRADIVAVDNE